MPGHGKGSVVHVIEGKQQRINAETGDAERILPSPHRLRDTHSSALIEVGGISPFAIPPTVQESPTRGNRASVGSQVHSDDDAVARYFL